MPEVELRAGAKVNFLNEQELGDQLAHVANRFERMTRDEQGENLTFVATTFTTNATGAATGNVYTVPVGHTASLTRLSITYPTATAKTGGHKCDVRICQDGNALSGMRVVESTLPVTYEASKSHAPIFRSGTRVSVVMKTGPHSTRISVNGQVILTPLKSTHADALTSNGDQ